MNVRTHVSKVFLLLTKTKSAVVVFLVLIVNSNLNDMITSRKLGPAAGSVLLAIIVSVLKTATRFAQLEVIFTVHAVDKLEQLCSSEVGLHIFVLISRVAGHTRKSHLFLTYNIIENTLF